MKKVGEKYKETKGGEGREKGGKDGQRMGEKLAKITRKGRGKREKKEEESMARSEKSWRKVQGKGRGRGRRKRRKGWPEGGEKLVKGTRKGRAAREGKRHEENKKRI